MRYQLLGLGLITCFHRGVEDDEAGATAADPPPIDLLLSAKREEQGVLLSYLRVMIPYWDGLQSEIGYYAAFALEPEEEDDDVERETRSFAARIAPAIIYPYIRETFSSLAQKSGRVDMVLPVLGFVDMFDPDTIDFSGELLGPRRPVLEPRDENPAPPVRPTE